MEVVITYINKLYLLKAITNKILTQIAFLLSHYHFHETTKSLTSWTRKEDGCVRLYTNDGGIMYAAVCL